MGEDLFNLQKCGSDSKLPGGPTRIGLIGQSAREENSAFATPGPTEALSSDITK